ncbi:MAG: SLOG family protein [Planctomycetota bacterium]
MRFAVVGSRRYPFLHRVRAAVRGIAAGYPDAVIVSGGARGVDRVAEQQAEACGLGIDIIRPDWGTHGKRAGILRNAEIVRRADRVIAFWDGVSRGTKSTSDMARKAGKPTTVFGVYGDDHEGDDL